MDDKVLDPDGARERMKAWKGRIDQLAADTKAMSDQLQALQVTTGDPRGLVRVTVDSTGALVGLQLTHQIEGVAPDVVARTVMDTIRRAKAELADRSHEIIADTVGTESAAARAIADSVDRQLRPGGEEAADPDEGRRPARPADDEDDEPFELKL